MAGWSVDWKGDELFGKVKQAAGQALVKWGQRVEGDAKRELYPGHGVITGTLRRSIHAAPAAYNFGQDDTGPSGASPERGNQTFEPTEEGFVLAIKVGSGLVYAMPVHEGHGKFGGYHYITSAFGKNQGELITDLSEALKAIGLI